MSEGVSSTTETTSEITTTVSTEIGGAFKVVDVSVSAEISTSWTVSTIKYSNIKILTLIVSSCFPMTIKIVGPPVNVTALQNIKKVKLD